MRFLRGYGHGPVASASPGLPLADLASVILGREGTLAIEPPKFAFKELGSFGVAEIPSEALADSQYRWRILEHADYVDVRSPEQPLYGAAHRLALRGLKALGQVPHARFGELLSIDRDEIEALRNLKRLIQNYLGDEGDKTALTRRIRTARRGKIFWHQRDCRRIDGRQTGAPGIQPVTI